MWMLVVVVLATVSSAANLYTIAVVADVHLDLNYDPTVVPEDRCRSGGRKSQTLALYGRKGCDGPYSLFISTLNKLKSVNPNPDLILAPGDMVNHFLPINENLPFDPVAYAAIQKVIANYTATMAQEFPNTPIIFTSGNNDYLYNYQVPDLAHKAMHNAYLYDKWIHSIKANANAVALRSY